MRKLTGKLLGYCVDEQGTVYSRRTGKPLSLKKDAHGYVRARMRIGGKLYEYKVHRLVAETYIPNPHNYPMVNHKDLDKTNNCVDNLEWCDAQYNMEHALAKTFWFISPDGEVIKVFNLTKFARENNLIASSMNQVWHGKYKQHRNWRKHICDV